MPLNKFRRPLSVAAIAIGLGTASCAGATPAVQSRELASPMQAAPPVWSVSDEDTTVILFAVPEIVRPDAEWRKGAYEQALATADGVFLESDPDENVQLKAQQLIQGVGMYRDGGNLLTALDDEQRARYSEAAGALGVPPEALAPLKPWVAAIQLGALSAQRQGYAGWSPGLALVGADAKKLGKPLTFLDGSALDAMSAIAGLEAEAHIGLLMSAIDGVLGEADAPARNVDDWLSGNVASLAARYHGEGAWGHPDLYRVVLLDRNRKWADAISQTLDGGEGEYLVVVSLGHLLGEDSLQSMLEKQGYEVVQE